MRNWCMLDVFIALFFIPILILMWVRLIIFLLSLFNIGPCAEGC